MNAQQIPALDIKVIIGLGNPGPIYSKTRHNIGFLVVNSLAEQYQGQWESKNSVATCSVIINDHTILLVKPLMFMNNSGQALTALSKKGIKAENILVIHDELELPFGTLKFKFDGSPKGHNGLKSIIAHIGSNFLRLRFGVDRPTNREEVPNYVLAKFHEKQELIDEKIHEATVMITNYLSS